MLQRCLCLQGRHVAAREAAGQVPRWCEERADGNTAGQQAHDSEEQWESGRGRQMQRVSAPQRGREASSSSYFRLPWSGR
jgi:hypothetical protein